MDGDLPPKRQRRSRTDPDHKGSTAHPDLVANGDIIEHHHPELGTVRQIGPIAQLVATPGSAERPAPAVGADTEAMLAEPLPSPATPSTPDGSFEPGQPLAGVTVLEFSTIIAAPLAATMLADLGARVIKVEPTAGDPYRQLYGPQAGSLLASKTNAGKESITLDLKSPEATPILRGLVEQADVLLHNYRPGIPEKLGIGYEDYCRIRPDGVWVSANGYGPDCPSSRRPATHPVAGASMGGVLHQAGAAIPPARCESREELREVARQIMKANDANPDPNASAIIATATLIALLVSRRSGRGQPVYVNMLVASAWANGSDFLDYAGKPPRSAVMPT